MLPRVFYLRGQKSPRVCRKFLSLSPPSDSPWPKEHFDQVSFPALQKLGRYQGKTEFLLDFFPFERDTLGSEPKQF